MINSNYDIQNGYYGKYIFDKNNIATFVELGKEIKLDSISKNIETDLVKLNLSFEYQGSTVKTTIDRSEIGDPKLMTFLAGLGADVTKKNFDIVVDTLRIQEEELQQNGVAIENEFQNLGWIKLSDENDLGYRAEKLVGNMVANYTGDLKITPMGNFSKWLEMVNDKVLGHPVLELSLIVGLSAIVNGMIGNVTTGENPIVHFCSRSGTGKTTAGFLAASVFGEPFNGLQEGRRSVYGTWGSTSNAIISQCVGNRGAVIVLNELGKFLGSDMTSIIYNLSEGTDKTRLTKELKCSSQEGFFTSFLSLGEFPILDRCKSRMEGLSIRVLEIDTPVTDSAEQADTIKKVCQSNNGWAASKMAEYIINSGGLEFVLNKYEENRAKLLEEWKETPSKERFVSKFPALFVTTAQIATEALEINFNIEIMKNFLMDLDEKNGFERNFSAQSFDFILEQCFINKQNFYVISESTNCRADLINNMPSRELWGRIIEKKYEFNGKFVIREIEIVKSVLEKMLEKGGYKSKKNCINEWKKAKVLNYEDDHHATRKRKIDPGAPIGSRQEVYVFRVFASEEDEQEIKKNDSYTNGKNYK